MSAEEKNDQTAAEAAVSTAGKTAKKVATTKKKRGRPTKAELAARAAGTPSPSLESPQPTASVQPLESAPAPTETTGTPPAAAATRAALLYLLALVSLRRSRGDRPTAAGHHAQCMKNERTSSSCTRTEP